MAITDDGQGVFLCDCPSVNGINHLEVELNPTIDFVAGTVAVRLSSLKNVHLQRPFA